MDYCLEKSSSIACLFHLLCRFLFQLVDVDTDWNDFPKMPLPSFIRVELLGQSISIALTL